MEKRNVPGTKYSYESLFITISIEFYIVKETILMQLTSLDWVNFSFLESELTHDQNWSEYAQARISATSPTGLIE